MNIIKKISLGLAILLILLTCRYPLKVNSSASTGGLAINNNQDICIIINNIDININPEVVAMRNKEYASLFTLESTTSNSKKYTFNLSDVSFYNENSIDTVSVDGNIIKISDMLYYNSIQNNESAPVVDSYSYYYCTFDYKTKQFSDKDGNIIKKQFVINYNFIIPILIIALLLLILLLLLKYKKHMKDENTGD